MLSQPIQIRGPNGPWVIVGKPQAEDGTATVITQLTEGAGGGGAQPVSGVLVANSLTELAALTAAWLSKFGGI